MINNIFNKLQIPTRHVPRDICRTSLQKFLKNNSTSELTLDIGSRNQIYRPLFPNATSIDIVFDKNLDLIGDIHFLPFKEASYSIVLCTEVLEHCLYPKLAIDEMYRVLKYGGKLILTTRFIFPIHEAPNDYYRFTRYALKKLFMNFSEVTIIQDTTGFESLGVLFQRLAYQCRFVININYLFHILSKILCRLEFLVSDYYSGYNSKIKIENIMPSGYHVVAIK